MTSNQFKNQKGFHLKFIYLLLFLFIFNVDLIAQKKYTISGYIREKGSRELLIGVNIYIPGTQTGTTTNNYGFYSLTLPEGQYKLMYSYVGYVPYDLDINLDKNIDFSALLESQLELKGVEIKAQRQEKISETSRMSTIDLPVAQLRDMPAFLGERDVFKALMLMPGVQSGSEGSTGLYVRGGGPDQNLIILDDAVVYNANHLFGFFSVFNGDALKSIELTKGGFPARYGGRLSSVIDMNMKDGNKEKIAGEVGIGVISSRMTLEGPLKKEKASFLISARRTYIDLLIRPFMKADEGIAGYYFYDLNAKVNYDFGNKDKLYISGYFGRDKFFFRQKDTYSGSTSESSGGLFWQNSTGTIRWNHLFNNKLFANTSFIYSNYLLKLYANEIDGNDYFKLSYSSGIEDFSLKYDLTYIPNPNHHIKFGIISTQHRFTPSAIVIKESDFDDFKFGVKPIEATESGIYIEDDWKLNPKTKMNAGIRLSHFIHKEKNYFNLEPRIAASYMINEELSVKASYATMNQYIHLLSNTGIGLPTDLWVPATNRTTPQQSHQIASGFAKDFTKQNFAISIEGYYKKMNNIVGYKEGATFLLIDDPTGAEEFTWEDNITKGKGWSYGTEFLLQRKYGMLSGWIGYTLSWTQHQFEDVNFGEKYYTRYDRRHDFSVVAIYKAHDYISFSATWVYGTGNAITLATGEYYAFPHEYGTDQGSGSSFIQYVNDYGEKNSFRMAPYHRLDIGMQITHKLKGKATGTIDFSIYNAYNRKNPFFYYVGSDSKGNSELRQVSIFPILPSLSYSIKF